MWWVQSLWRVSKEARGLGDRVQAEKFSKPPEGNSFPGCEEYDDCWTKCDLKVTWFQCRPADMVESSGNLRPRHFTIHVVWPILLKALRGIHLIPWILNIYRIADLIDVPSSLPCRSAPNLCFHFAIQSSKWIFQLWAHTKTHLCRQEITLSNFDMRLLLAFTSSRV